MELFIDTANIIEIQDLLSTGLVSGITTNPSLIAKSGRNFLEVIKEICAIFNGSVSAEVAATEFHKMMQEADVLRKIASNVTIKLPLTWDGLKACKKLTDEGTETNITLCFSATQALLAAKAGATYISPFIGRLDDVAFDGMQLIEEIRTIYNNYPEITTKILAASIRHPLHVKQAALLGADCATIPPQILKQMVSHPFTDKGVEAFVKDWQGTGQKIVEFME